jgi:probable HAF family extracellular repeat protein
MRQARRPTSGSASTVRGHASLRRRAVSVACVSAGLLCLAAAPALASTYTVTDLGSLGYGTTFATAINAHGQITGESYLGTTVPVPCRPRQKPPCVTHPGHAFLYGGGTMSDLGTLGGLYSGGAAINISGELAGWSYTLTGNIQAFVDQNGTMTNLGALVPSGESRASAINDSGVVAGNSSTNHGTDEAFIYRNGKMNDLGLLPGEGGIFTDPSGINNSGQVVGAGDNAASDERAFLYSNGKMTDLGTLGGPQASAAAINNLGQIVGSAQTSSDASHPFLYSSGKMTDLGAFNLQTTPEAINDSGVIVGQTYGQNRDGSTFFHAVIYTGGKFQDLNNLIPAGSGFVLTGASGVNDNGQIVADGSTTTTGQNHAFLLTPS